MHPYLFEMGNFRMPTYGLFVALGYISGAFYFISKRRLADLSKEKAYDTLFWVILSAIIGGKILYILTFWNEFGTTFPERLLESLRSIRYGFVFYGGLIASATALFFFCKRNGIDFLKTTDILSPSLALGHAIGRLGCFCAGCCHGRPTDSFLGIVFSNPESLVKPQFLNIPIHPTQLYSSFSNFAIFFLLNMLLMLQFRRDLKAGIVTASYGILYSLSRFITEFFRGDERGFSILGLSQGQIISVAVFLFSAYFFGKSIKWKMKK